MRQLPAPPFDATNDRDTLLAGKTEMHARMRAFDWSQCPLGPVSGWPLALRTHMSVILASPYAACVYWGPDLVFLYNDGIIPILGAKHPGVLGLPAREALAEIWDVIGAMFEQVLATDTALSVEDQPLFLLRKGVIDEAYFTFAYIPIRDENAHLVGVECIVTETTRQVFGTRRVRTLRELSIRTALAEESLGVLHATQEVLAESGADVPFALLYRVNGDTARLAVRSGLEAGSRAAPIEIALDAVAPWPLGEVLLSGKDRVVADLGESLGELRAGPWPEPVSRALLLPLSLGGSAERDAVLVIGLSPRLHLDEAYRDFLELLARQIAAEVVRVRALEQEKERAAKLAELDRQKTAFFSNVSHEFRTPLTLILGPTEDALASPEGSLRGEQLERVHGNAQRLLRLVNTLLEFSRVEAGKSRATFLPTDLAPLTAGLANAFEPTITNAGLRFVVDCPPLPEPVWVDAELWEKVVLNLVSNAFKFTFEGEIAVRLRWTARGATLTVADTGTGIAAEELPKLFQRFHRVEGARGRSHEGSGIGLSLAHELVKLHGGELRVASTPGKGTTFTASLPRGHAHLPAESVSPGPRPAAPRVAAAAFVREATHWLVGSTPENPRGGPEPAGPKGRVLLVDDNADMRSYLQSVLDGPFVVEAVVDGRAALAAARERLPDVILSDVMMPGLDGMALMRALREDPKTRDVPVILLSARAGESATVEGLEAGASDYLVKPFGARELVARIEGAVQGARVGAERRRLLQAANDARVEAEVERARFHGLLIHTPLAIAILEGPAHTFTFVNPAYRALISGRDPIGRTLFDALPETQGQGFDHLLDQVKATGKPYFGNEVLVRLREPGTGGLKDRNMNFVYSPLPDPSGQLNGVIASVTDVTAMVEARRIAERAAQETKDRLSFEQQLIGIVSHDLRNPLNVIKLSTLILQRSDRLDERGFKTVARIYESADRANRLVKDLLDFTQARLGGGIRVNRRPGNLHEMLRSVFDELHAAYAERDVELRTTGSGEGEWDGDRLGQVVQNLATNALTYSPSGTPVRLLVAGATDSVDIVVHNLGAPIPAERIESIFQPLQRGVDQQDRASRSVGLGLYIVKQIVTAHGGTIAVTSTGEAGTTFTVHLPRHPRPPAQ